MIDDVGVALTPQIEALVREAYEVFEEELEHMRADQAEIEARRDGLRRGLPGLYEATVTAEERFASAASRLPEQDRRLGEESLDLATVRRRRRTEYERGLQELTLVVAERRRAVHQAEAEWQALTAGLSGRVDEMRQRCARYGHFTERRIAIYWRSYQRAYRPNRRSSWKPLPQPWARWAMQKGFAL